MSAFLRGKQTGMQKDLSASIAPTDFLPDDLARYGINSQIRYDFPRQESCDVNGSAGNPQL